MLILSLVKVKPVPAIFSFITNPELFSIALTGFNSIALPAILLGVVICCIIELEIVSISLLVIRTPEILGKVILILLLILFDFNEVILLLLYILIALFGLLILFWFVEFIFNSFKFKSSKFKLSILFISFKIFPFIKIFPIILIFCLIHKSFSIYIPPFICNAPLPLIEEFDVSKILVIPLTFKLCSIPIVVT